MKNENSLALLSKHRKSLMGFAALWILMTHEWQIISSTDSCLNFTEIFIKRIGFCGVDIFLLLSGMGLTYSIKKAGLGRFYFNRLKRVLIPFVAVGIIISIVDNWGVEMFFKNILGISFYTVSIYSFLWFVPAIVALYLIFPFYYKLFSLAKSKVVFTLGVLAVWLLLSMIFSDTLREDLYGFTNRIPIFVIGILIGWLCQNKNIIFSKGIWLFFVILLALGLYLSYKTNFNGLQILVPVSNCCVPNIFISVSLSFLIAKSLDILNKFKGTRWLFAAFSGFLNFFGMMSLEFYCIQEWLASKVLENLVEYFGNACANLALLVIVSLSGLVLFFINKFFVFCIDKMDEILFKRKEFSK